MPSRKYNPTMLLVSGFAAAAMIAAAPAALATPNLARSAEMAPASGAGNAAGGPYCGQYCGGYRSYNADYLGAATHPAPPLIFPGARELPIFDGSGAIRQR
jgi:hypothetical protein